MRRSVVFVVCAVVVLLLTAQRGSALPTVHLVSPALGFNSNQRLECTVVNGDGAAHEVTIAFYDSTGAVVSGNPPQLVPPHGSAGLSFPYGAGASHCEITAPGHAEWYRASIDIIDTTAPVLPQVVVALPIW